ncbi:biotin--[acetyl-CoA-carboxylase] ligase [Nocardioides aequoreus]|uniref:biotin--[acetyl-CoA-carboxylase] ligase n=1 Tax=Nocardioides aequoreus TaxID=397278 RepID=UPI0004C31377|nr:biotin--[acetyl-CoA-carboxylase] ligase [Nocardioides aequoreus]
MTSSADSRPPIAPLTHEGWEVEVVPESASTNAELAERFRAGAGERLALAAQHQTAGRGRLGRDWVVTPGSSLTVSFLLEPDVEARRWTWLPLLTGVATARAVTAATGLGARLKWPNDVLVDDAKVGGILLERVEREGHAAAVVGVGLNVLQTREELPVETATSLALAGVAADRTTLLAALLRELDTAYDAWLRGEDLRAAYLGLCSTLGRAVRVTVPGGVVEGEAVDVDADGRIVVRTAAGEEHLGAGDVVHVRPAGGTI